MSAKLSQLLEVFGWRGLLQRGWNRFERRSGLMRLRAPARRWESLGIASLVQATLPADEEALLNDHWRRSIPWVFDSLPDMPVWDTDELLGREAEEFLIGKLRFFNGNSLMVGFPPPWNEDPSSGRTFSLKQHWSSLNDEGQFDIKYVWEPSRFTWAYLFLRQYQRDRDERWPEAFWSAFADWMAHNQPNQGPAWMDGQECALRLTAVLFALHAFRRSPSLTPARFASVMRFAAMTARRITANISYALSTASNHGISEAAGLYLTGQQFPELRDAQEWKALGRKILLEQAERQFFPDGGYSMYSLNYQRFSLQLMILCLRLSELEKDPFPGWLRERISAASDFLHALIDPQTGRMPNLGSNDGSLPLRLNSCAFYDFRPLLQLCGLSTSGKVPFPAGPWDEDALWLFGGIGERSPLKSRLSLSSFPEAGLIQLADEHGNRALLHSAHFTSRPSQEDNLHVDIWLQHQPVAIDAGTFTYNSAPPWRDGLAAAEAHNTLVVDGGGPMRRLSRFTWAEWSQAQIMLQREDHVVIRQNGFLRLPDPVSHARALLRLPDAWLVADRVKAMKSHRLRVHWLLEDHPAESQPDGLRLEGHDFPIFISLGAREAGSRISHVRAQPGTARGWQSPTYGVRAPAHSLALTLEASSATFWTLFSTRRTPVTCTADEIRISIQGKIFRYTWQQIFHEEVGHEFL